jgi:hypothetical protein
MYAPLDNSNKVFKKGMAKASRGVIPTGGHTKPSSTAGDKLE